MGFNKTYQEFKWVIDINARKYAKKSGEDEDDLRSFLNTEFWLVYQNFKKERGNMETFLNVSLQRRVIDYLNLKPNKFNRSVKPFSSVLEKNEDDEDIEFDIEDTYNLETHVINSIEKKKTDEDKRQLINALVRNADPLTTAIINEYLKNSDAKPTAIGRKLGVHHEVVKRKLKYLARNYDENKFGEIDAYLVS